MKLFQRLLVAGAAMSMIAPIGAQASNINLEDMNSYASSSKSKGFNNNFSTIQPSDWADVIRKTFKDGGVDEIISTRRLVHIAEAYAIFKNKMKAIEVCTNRFDESTKTSFVDLYTKVDSGASAEQILEDKKKAEEAEILQESKQDSDDSEDGEEDFSV